MIHGTVVCMEELLKELDALIEDAPLDFLGTGSDSRHADKKDREWHTDYQRIRAAILAKWQKEKYG